VLLDQEDFPRARKEFLRIRSENPRSHGARLGLLFLEANEGNYRLAISGTRTLAEEGSTSPELYYLRGILADHEGQVQEAQSHFQRALFLDNNCLMARLKLAEILAQLGDPRGSFREARNLLEQLRNLEPGALVPLSGGLSREALEALCLGLLSEEMGW
jgi:tetratricopeptide (TPR) repeat protein